MDAAPIRQPRSLAKRLVFACIPVLVLLGTLELVVRVLRLDQSCPSDYNKDAVWACDPVLNFKLKPGLIAGGKPVNRAGFRNREFTPKPPGVFRIVSLGDSCTFGIVTREMFEYIPEPYPQLLERLAAERIGAGKLEVLNAGIAGYNSFQGVMLLRTKLRGLEPNLITVRYGWNDHFMSALEGGAYSYREPDSELVLRLQDLMLRTSLYGFFRRLGFEVRALRARATPPPRVKLPTQWIPIVPLDAYKHNLRRIVALGRAQGAHVWLLTAPHAFVVDINRGRHDRFPMSAKALLEYNAIPSFERLIEIHDSYNQATREVGAELRVPVVDMDAVYRAHASEPLFHSTDVPHPAAAGHVLEAETLYERLWSEGLLVQRR
jgi:lysophospholipase L1-like esterase